jgi:hypothetical protein
MAADPGCEYESTDEKKPSGKFDTHDCRTSSAAHLRGEIAGFEVQPYPPLDVPAHLFAPYGIGSAAFLVVAKERVGLIAYRLMGRTELFSGVLSRPCDSGICKIYTDELLNPRGGHGAFVPAPPPVPQLSRCVQAYDPFSLTRVRR